MLNNIEDGIDIFVKNAEGDSDTKATIIHQNSIDYTPKISVIIPVYNTEEYLRECLDSVVNQTLKEIEIICVDDGSTDSSLEILKEYAKKDNRFTIVTQKNLHAGVARNAGITVAKGEYLSFLDSDDYFNIEMQKTMYNIATSKKADIVVCKASKFDDKTRKILNVFGINEKIVSEKDTFSAMDFEEAWSDMFIPAAWNKIYKTSFIKKNNIFFQNLLSCNDIGFSYCATSIAKKITVVSDVFVFYRKNTENCISANRGETAINIILAYNHIKNFLQNRSLDRFIDSLDRSIISNIRFEVSNCSMSQLLTFKSKAKKILGVNFVKFADCFIKRHYSFSSKKILETIFSIKNNETKTHKIITIFGLRIKIKRTKKRKNITNIDIRDKSVLLVEINRYHGECLPGMAKYFIDLGYNVDVLMSNEEAQLNPFSDFKNDKLKIYALKSSAIKEILCSDIMERYDHLYINSNVVKGVPVGEYLGNDIKYPSGKIITLCHDIKSKDEINFNTENASIISLLDFPNVNNKEIRKVNTHYFKDIVKHEKNKIVKFIVVGNIEAKRKNHNLLIDAVSQLLSENITNFRIVVVSRIGNLEIPKELNPFFEIKGRLSYEAMYKELEKADFFLTLFDPDNVEHNRYLTTGASGSYQLIYGFNLPCLLPYKFQVDINGFNNQNSIGYADNNHFCKAMKMAIQMNNEKYNEYKNNLMSLANEIYKTSLNNLREILDENTNMFPNNLFVSLGVNCFNRVVLTRHHLKNKKSDGEKSLPFDLCVCPLDTMVFCLENDFKDYFISLKYDKKDNIWKNSKLKISYNHDQDCSSKDKNKLIKRYEDRINNLRELLKDKSEKVFIISLLQVKENDDKLINKVHALLEKKCNSLFKLVVVSIDKNNKIENKKLNKNIYYKHISHPYPNYWGEWYKGEYFNSPEGKAFEKKYIDFVLSCVKK